MSQAKALARPSFRRLFIVIGADRIECGLMTGRGSACDWVEGSVAEVRFDPESGKESFVKVLGGLLPQLQGLRPVSQVRVVIADRWLALGSVPWNHSMGNHASAIGYGKAQLIGAGFEVGPEDTVRLDDMPFGAPRLVVAYPNQLLAELRQLSESLGAHLVSVLPLSVAAWQVVREEQKTCPAALAVLDNGAFLFAIGDEGQCGVLRDVIIRTGMDDGSESEAFSRLHKAWQRLCLRDPRLNKIEQLKVLSLAEAKLPVSLEKPFARLEWPPLHAVAKWEKAVSSSLCLAALSSSVSHALDALPAKPMLTRWRLLSFGILLLFVGFVVFQAVQMNSFKQVLESRVRTAKNVLPAPAPAAPWSNEERARIQAVNAAIRELNLPISPILRALQPPQDIRVAVLSVETSALASSNKLSNVKITAEAQTGAEMARYVAFVAERKPFTGAYLLRHEIDERSAERPYRFTVEIQWND